MLGVAALPGGAGARDASPARPPAAAPGQEVTVVVRVRAEADESPLANAEVIDRATGTRALTRESGEARVRVFPDRALELRVRQLGFSYRDVTLLHASLRGGGRDTIDVRLARIPFALPAVETTAARDCPAVPPDAAPLAFWALGQLREGAERYESFRKAYPFRVTSARVTSVRTAPDRPARATRQLERTDSDRWGDRYAPGAIVQRTPFGYSLPILFISTLGDPRFWEHHCVTSAGVEGTERSRRVRLHFVPSPSARGSDWEGNAILDSASSLLQRVEFTLRVNQPDGPRRFEGYTTFRSPSPLIVVPDSTAAIWWRTAPAPGEGWGEPHVVQLVTLDQLEFRRAKPPQ